MEPIDVGDTWLECDKEERKETRKLRTSAETISHGIDKRRRSAFDDLGICKDCCNLYALSTMYGHRKTFCEVMKKPLDPGDVVVDCTMYGKIGLLNLNQMREMAIPIEIKRSMGFVPEPED